MAKLVLLLAIIVVVALLVRRLFKGASTNRAEAPGAAQSEAPSPEAKLVRCVECGAFVPKAEALAVPNGFRCGGAGCNSNR